MSSLHVNPHCSQASGTVARLVHSVPLRRACWILLASVLTCDMSPDVCRLLVLLAAAHLFCQCSTCDLGDGDKRVLRAALRRLGLPRAAGRVKRAIQFGSRIGTLVNRYTCSTCEGRSSEHKSSKGCQPSAVCWGWLQSQQKQPLQ